VLVPGVFREANPLKKEHPTRRSGKHLGDVHNTVKYLRKISQIFQGVEYPPVVTVVVTEDTTAF